MAKKTTQRKGQQRTPSASRAGRATSASRTGAGGRRKTGGAKTAKARKQATGSPRSGSLKKTGARAGGASRKGAAAKKTGAAKKTRTAKKAGTARKTGSVKTARGSAKGGARKGAGRENTRGRRGGSGREETLAQTPETGRTVKGPTNPMPTKRSTGTASGAGTSRSGRLTRERTELRELEEGVPTPPSSLDLDRLPSAARSGRRRLHDAREEHTETSPVLTGGDVDANWEDAYAVGDEAPGGDNPTPDQDRVDDIGKALGVVYEDNEELKASDKIADRDRHRWELDPASSEDYNERD